MPVLLWPFQFVTLFSFGRASKGRQLASCPLTPSDLHSSWNCPAEDLSAELIRDATFSPGSWTNHLFKEGGASFDFSSGRGVLMSPQEDTDSTPWHVQLIQAVSLGQDGDEGSSYRLCLQAWSSKVGKIQFGVDGDGALNFAVAGGGVRSQLTLASEAALSSGCFNFHLGPDLSKYVGRVSLDLGDAGGQLTICQASLKRCAVRPQASGLVPIRRCYLAPVVNGTGGCSLLQAFEGDEFGLNEFKQETSGKLACLERMRGLGGNTFVFEVGRCEVWRCGSRALLLQSATGTPGSKEVFSRFCEYQEPTGGRRGAEIRAPVFIQLWEWNFVDIARECVTFLGPNGVEGVQVSPVTEHILGKGWWTKYQPVSFRLNSRSGNAQDFRNMVATCRAAGVQIIVDVILNHIAAPCSEALAQGSAQVMPCKGWADSQFGNRRISSDEGWKGPELFHHSADNTLGNCGVDEVTWECPNSSPPGDCSLCDFKGLPDWNTGQQVVQDILFQHLSELYRIGVTMLRIDAASYVSTEELAAIINRAPWDYVYQEWWGGIPEESRTQIVGAMRDAAYGQKITNALAVGDVKSLATMLNITHGLDGIHPERANYPLTFHDQRTVDADRFIPTYKNGLEFHQQQKFLLAWPTAGSVRLWGGYTFTTLDEGPPGRCGSGRCAPTPVYTGASDEPRCMPTPEQSPLPKEDETRWSGWVCEHRWDGVAGLVNFRKTCAGEPMTQVWSDSSVPAVGLGQFAWRSGTKCFAALVRGQNQRWPNYWGQLGDWRLAGLVVGLPAGRYCDLASLPTQKCWDRRTCPREVTIGDDGSVVTGTVREGDLLAIHIDARLDNRSSATGGCGPDLEVPSGSQRPAGGAAFMLGLLLLPQLV